LRELRALVAGERFSKQVRRKQVRRIAPSVVVVVVVVVGKTDFRAPKTDDDPRDAPERSRTASGHGRAR
jgi:hypothetical protein